MSNKGKASIAAVGKEFLAGKKCYVPLRLQDEESVEGKIVVITGANSGIGAIAAMELAKRHAIVVMCCRDMEKAEKVKDKINFKIPDAKLDLVPLDLGNLDSVRKCAGQIKEKYSHINILINNAGILFRGQDLKKTSDGFEAHMGINHLGNFLFTHLLLDLVKAGAQPSSKSRIVFVGSTAHLFAELDLKDLMLEKRGKVFGMNNLGPYSNSKLANLYFTRELTKRVEGTGISVSVLCPGYVKTDFFRSSSWWERLKTNFGLFLYGSSPEEGADVILYCSLSTRLSETNGQMYRFNKVWPGVVDALDDLIGKELWEKSEKLVGLSN